jgi:hypothetical protein
MGLVSYLSLFRKFAANDSVDLFIPINGHSRTTFYGMGQNEAEELSLYVMGGGLHSLYVCSYDLDN